MARVTFVTPVVAVGLLISLVFTLSRLCLQHVISSVQHISSYQTDERIFVLYWDEPCLKACRGVDESVDRLRELHMSLYDNIRSLNSLLSDGLFMLTLCCRAGIFIDLYFYAMTQQLFLLKLTFTNVIVILTLSIVCSRYSDTEEKLKNALSLLDFREFGRTKKLEFELFQLQVNYMQTQFTAMKFFSYNMNFLVTVLITSFGYMMILKQLGI